MIACIGDVHRSFHELARLVRALPAGVDAVFQVGDLGLEPPDVYAYPPAIRLDRPVHFIDGNWDHFGPWAALHGRGYRDLRAPVELLPNLIYVPRGTVMTVGARRVACLGGAESRTGLASRHPGLNWWPAAEGIDGASVERLYAAVDADPRPVDLLVTHVPPAAVLRERFGAAHEPIPSARVVQAVWERLGRPLVVSGHQHQSWRAAPPAAAIVLGELEVVCLP